MGFSVGHKWAEEEKARLRELLINGYTRRDAARQLTKEWGFEVTVAMVEGVCTRHGLTNYLLPKDTKIKTYKELTLPYDNYMISCDHHAPYFSELWVNRKLAIADKFGVKKDIEIGDVFDFDFVSRHPQFDGEKPRWIEDEAFHCEPLIKALDYFDEVYVLRGNHEWRITRYTDSKIQAKHLYGVFGKDIWLKKFKYSVYDKMNIGQKWMLVHPQSYSQISTSVAKRLAEKYHRNIINAHGHLFGMTYDRSGKFLCIDLGGMFEKKKISYINLQTTAHPIWKNAFGMLYDGHFYSFTEETDWGYWLGK